MAYVPGTTYVGLTALEYQQLQGMGNQQINAFLTAYFSQLPGEDFYIFNGSDLEFLGMLEDCGITPGTYGSHFVYLYSTWNVTGF